MLRGLNPLKHSKVHNISNESKRSVVIPQRMAVCFREYAVFFQSGKGMFNPYSDFPLLGVLNFLRSGKLFMAPGPFEWNYRMQFREILLDSLIIAIAIEPGTFGDDLGQYRCFENFVVMLPARTCSREVKNESF